MFKKIISTLGTKLFPYWCNYCPRRYRTEAKFHAHYLRCEARELALYKERIALEKIAPTNRKQRRTMAKKAGQIKDWKHLNAD
jgi:hypothetical protein